MQAHPVGPHWLTDLIPILVIALVIFLRLRRVNRSRPLKLGRLWIVPAIYGALVALVFVAQPPTAPGWAASAVGLLLGGLFGWQRGRTIRIHVNRETGELNQQASMAGLLFLVALIAVKTIALRSGAALHVSLATLTDALLGFALGTFTVMRIELFLRARRLIGSSHDPEATSLL